jgi:hypothetical protein
MDGLSVFKIFFCNIGSTINSTPLFATQVYIVVQLGQSTLPCPTPLPSTEGLRLPPSSLPHPYPLFFGTKTKPFLQSHFYLSHPFPLPCSTSLLSSVGLRPRPTPLKRLFQLSHINILVQIGHDTCTFTKNN